MSQIHVIAHTHWDQEWYFTRQDSMVLASYNFAEVIETLEQDPAWQCYHLDGQMAVVDDFLAINPDYRPRLEKLVREKSVFVGPWFTQTDTYNVHGRIDYPQPQVRYLRRSGAGACHAGRLSAGYLWA
jgi:alpha-mannosidase